MELKNALIFLGGVAVGVAGTFYFAKTRYLTIAEEEIDSIKMACDRKIDEIMDAKESEDVSKDISSDFDREAAKKSAQENNKYKEAISNSINYTGYFKTEDKIVAADTPSKESYVISDEDYAESGFGKITLTYFEEDGVFINVAEDIVENGLELIGKDNLEHFGEFEDGVLFVRNDFYQTDYEVVYDSGSYSVYAGE